MTSELITCPNCGKKMPKSIIKCWHCGKDIHPELGKESPDESREGRNPTFLDREQRLPKRRKEK